MNVVIAVESPRKAEAFRRERLPVARPSEIATADVIVNWTALRERPPQWQGMFVLNRPEAVALARDATSRKQIWRHFGLEDRMSRLASVWYRVYVFDFRILAVFLGIRRASKRRFRRVRPSNDKELEKVGEAAIRALHALRLDFGAVDIAPRGDVFAVVGLRLRLSSSGKIARAYAEAIKRYMQRWARSPRDFLLGADPEFIIRDRKTRTLVIASRYLSREGRVGLDSQRVRGTRFSRPIVEVRPPPAYEPAELVRSIAQLLRTVPRALRRRNLGWYAGSGPMSAYPIGGHIHFGGLPLTAGLIRAMDAYIALPVLLIEDSSRARRRRSRYGNLGEVRFKKWGFEYRTLPSWLVAPHFAEAVLSLTKLVCSHWRELRLDPFLNPELVSDFYNCRKNNFYLWFDQIWADIQSLPDYAAYAKSLNVFPQLVLDRKRWYEERDFRREWGLA